MADKGYDVYVYNPRGNSFSSNHIKLQSDSYAYWDFSWDEMGYYDMPAIIDDIDKQTGGDKEITLIGHSEGTTANIVLFTTRPEYNDKIKSCIHLAPTIYMEYQGSPLKEIETLFYSIDFLRNFGIGFPGWLQRIVILILCTPGNGIVCDIVLNFLFGPSNVERIPVSLNIKILQCNLTIFNYNIILF